MIYKLLNKKNKIFEILCMFTMALILCGSATVLGLSEYHNEIFSVAVLGIISMFVMLVLYYFSQSKSEWTVLAFGYFLRIILCVLDVYGKDMLVLPNSGGDSEGFWKTAVFLYRGCETFEYTKYPYILEAFFHIFGENRVLVQYSNILFWVGTAAAINGCFEKLKIEKNTRLFGILLISFMPQYMILSSLLLRESMIIFFIASSLYFFLSWCFNENFKHIFLAGVFVLCSMVLHSGTVGVLAGYGIIYACYSPSKRKFVFGKRTCFVIVLILALGIAALKINYIKHFFLAYIPSFHSLLDISKKYFDSGASDYLKNMGTGNYVQFAINTVIRSIYFQISPMPWDWRGLQDIIAFFLDSLLRIAIWIGVIKNWRNKNKYNVITMLFIFINCFYLVFAWGVSNAGTAIRHRNKIIAIEIVLLCYCLQKYKGISNRKKKEK